VDRHILQMAACINILKDTPDGLKNLAVGICRAKQNWTMANFVGQELARIRKLVGTMARYLGLSVVELIGPLLRS
jgi:hypothetical protein